MTRIHHDQFAKQLLEELISPLGTTEISKELSEVRQADLYFIPAAQPDPDPLGLLGRMVLSGSCLLEAYRDPPDRNELRICLMRLYMLCEARIREAEKTGRGLVEADLPQLWILSPTLSKRILTATQAIPSSDWLPGVYQLSDLQRTHLVAIHRLPVTPDTLWIRLLGRGRVQAQAIEELMTLPQDHPSRAPILELLFNWRIVLQERYPLEPSTQELIMNLSPAYLRWREETLERGKQVGRQEGRQAGRQETIESLLISRFGGVDPELAQRIPIMLTLASEQLIPLLLTLSREQLIERFRSED